MTKLSNKVAPGRMSLEQAARALLAHWDTPAWKYLKPTGDLMADLREALEKPYADKEAMFAYMKDMVRIDPVTGNVGIGTPSKQSVSQEPVAYKYKESSPETGEFIFAEQAEQEPVAIGSEWKPCMKLPVVVHVREQRKGESHVSTREGITPVMPDDLIMRGVAGEEYPIGRELFNKTYTFDTDSPVRTKDLTEEEIMEIMKQPFNQREYLEQFARAVIAADREKNK